MIIKQGINCWRKEPASRVAFLVDGEAYFSAFIGAVSSARRSVFIIGWDIDGRTNLSPGARGGEGIVLGELLRNTVKKNKKLKVHILAWDFAMVYALEREWPPLYGVGWRKKRRIYFRMDGSHPRGGSHHQKIVVVDDKVAFVGGMELARSNWDTPSHSPSDPRRVNPDGLPYLPHHDVQIMIEGEAASALGELARERWKRASGRRPRKRVTASAAPWPVGVKADMENLEVAIARTEPRHAGRNEIREVERLNLSAISAARKCIYIENQYLTSAAIGDALEKRLREPDGPEVVMVMPLEKTGWLEHYTMDVLRSRMLERMRKANRFGRLKVFYPHIPGLGKGCVDVHSKLMIVDDLFVRIGSSNLNNRSMGLDTECDVAIESAGKGGVAAAIASLRDRLLAEHLGGDEESVRRAVGEEKSVIGAIARLNRGDRRLEELEGRIPEDVDIVVPDSALVDPEKPMDSESLINYFVPPEELEQTRRSVYWGGAALTLCVLAAAAWRFPIQVDVFSGEWLAGGFTWLKENPYSIFYVVAAYLFGGAAILPVNVMILGTVVVFGAAYGALYSMVGLMAGAMTFYTVGRLAGREMVRRVAGRRLNRISRRISRRGLWSVISIRVLPLAPFTVINLVAGATHIGTADFLLGTFIGVLPGLVAVTALAESFLMLARDPGYASLFLALFVSFAAVFFIFLLRRWFRRMGTGMAEKRRYPGGEKENDR